MSDTIVTQDGTKPGVNKLNGPTVTNGKIIPADIAAQGANPNDTLTFSGGVWTPTAPPGVESCSNIGAGAQVFKQKVGTNFEFRSFIGVGITVTQNANDITISTSGAFTESYTSPQQTITAAGSLTLAHGMAGIPTLMQLRLVNTSAELGYVPGDEVVMNNHHTIATTNEGAAMIPDATNLNVRYGSGAAVFDVLNKTTGVDNAINPAKWNAVFRAWR